MSFLKSQKRNKRKIKKDCKISLKKYTRKILIHVRYKFENLNMLRKDFIFIFSSKNFGCQCTIFNYKSSHNAALALFLFKHF